MHSVGSRDLLLVLYTFVVHFAATEKSSLTEMFSDDSHHGEHIESAGVSLGTAADAFDPDPG